jgi:hypothetical protein
MLPGPSTNGRRLSAEKLNFIFGISFSGYGSAKELTYFFVFFLLFIDGITNLDSSPQSNLLIIIKGLNFESKLMLLFPN